MTDVLWTDDALNAQADGSWSLPTVASLHSGDPGPAGMANEVSGGGYTRPSLSWSAAEADGPLGASEQPGLVGRVYEAPTFSIPADLSTPWLGYWSGSTFLGAQPCVLVAAAPSFQPNIALGR